METSKDTSLGQQKTTAGLVQQCAFWSYSDTLSVRLGHPEKMDSSISAVLNQQKLYTPLHVVDQPTTECIRPRKVYNRHVRTTNAEEKLAIASKKCASGICERSDLEDWRGFFGVGIPIVYSELRTTDLHEQK